jgi:hypothetical protein
MLRFLIHMILLSVFTKTSLAFVSSPMSLKKVKNPLILRTSFEQTWERYPSPDVVLNQLMASFPLLENPSGLVGSNCLWLDDENRSLLGDNNVTTGKPLSEKPNSAFIVWYAGCIKKFMDAERSILIYDWKENKINENVSYLGKTALTACQKKLSLPVNNKLAQICHWNDLSAQIRKQKIKEQINSLIGPEEIVIDLGIAQSLDDLTDKIYNEIQDYSSKKDGRYNFLSAQEEPNIIGATQIIKFLILMTDIIKF